MARHVPLPYGIGAHAALERILPMRLYTTILFVTAVAVTGCDRNSSRTRGSSSPNAAPVVASSSPPAGHSGSTTSYADVVDRVSQAVVTIRFARRLRAPEQFPF